MLCALALAAAEAKDSSRLRRAAEHGDPSAQYLLGVLYQTGDGVPKDKAAGAAWVRKAAEQGFSDAQNNIGVAYATGEGVAKDPAQALAWLRKAAAQGHAKGQFHLGVMYSNGQGVAKDQQIANGWVRKAAENGLDEAQFRLGVMYAGGTSGCSRPRSRARPTRSTAWARDTRPAAASAKISRRPPTGIARPQSRGTRTVPRSCRLSATRANAVADLSYPGPHEISFRPLARASARLRGRAGWRLGYGRDSCHSEGHVFCRF